MRGVKVVKVLVGVLTAGSLALGAGLALAATTESKVPEPAKTPAVAAPAAPAKVSGEKEAQETKAEQKAEKAQASKEKSEKEVAADRSVRGEVTAVEVAAKTLTVKTMRNKKEDIIGVEVPDAVKVTQGKAAKTLADIKVGDHVWMKYDRMSNKLVADEIHILPPQKTGAAKKKSS
jgi:Cu/Ag efflux protein CusF